jgi:hypothetical protein
VTLRNLLVVLERGAVNPLPEFEALFLLRVLSIFPASTLIWIRLLRSQSEDASWGTDIMTSASTLLVYTTSLGLCSRSFVNCFYGVDVSPRTRDKVTCRPNERQRNYALRCVLSFPREIKDNKILKIVPNLVYLLVDYVRFEVFTAMTMKKVVFWDVAPCRYCVN